MQTFSLHIPSMQCSHCTNKIQTFVFEIEGIQEIKFDLDSKMVYISFITPATKEMIIEAIRECGFEVNEIIDPT